MSELPTAVIALSSLHEQHVQTGCGQGALALGMIGNALRSAAAGERVDVAALRYAFLELQQAERLLGGCALVMQLEGLIPPGQVLP